MVSPTYSILLIESDSRRATNLRGMLHGATSVRFDAKEAATAREAKAEAENPVFDAILFSGIESAAKDLETVLALRRANPTLPIVAVFEKQGSGPLEESLQALADDALYREELDAPRLSSALLMVLERRRMEEELRLEKEALRLPVEQSFSQLLDQLDHAVFLVEAESGALVFANAVAHEWFGQSIFSVLEEVSEYGVLSGSELEMEIALSVAQLSNAELKSKPVDWNGQSCCLVSLRNISKRKRAENAYRSAQRRLELILKSSAVGFWSWDLRKRQLHFCPRWKSQLGYEDKDFSNTLSAYRESIHPQDRRAVEAGFRNLLKGRARDLEQTLRLRHADGDYRLIRCRVEVFPDDEGELAWVLGTHVEVTESQESDGLESAGEAGPAGSAPPAGGMAKELQGRIERLAGSIGDRAGVLGEHFRPDSRMARDLAELGGAAQRISALSECLRGTRSDSLEPGSADLDVNDLLRELEPTLAALMPSPASLSITQGSPLALPRSLSEETARLVLAEAVSLVADHVYSDFRSRVSVGVVSAGRDCIQISYQGTVVRDFDLKALQGHSGAVARCFDRNGGCTLELEFGSARVVEQKRDEAKGSAPCALLAEDDSILRLAIQSMLESLGYGVILAENGSSAVERFREAKARISLVLIDLHMPGMSGADVVRSIRSLDDGLPMIKMSGDDAGIVGELFSHKDPFSCFLPKPFGIAALKGAIGEVSGPVPVLR